MSDPFAESETPMKADSKVAATDDIPQTVQTVQPAVPAAKAELGRLVKMRGAGTAFWEVAEHEGEWYFGLWSANGRLVATSSKGYAKKKNAIEACRAAQHAAAGAGMVLEAVKPRE